MKFDVLHSFSWQGIRHNFRRSAARGIYSVCVYGGAPRGPQLRELRAGAHLVVGAWEFVSNHWGGPARHGGSPSLDG